MRVLELYSGIGGMHCALRESAVSGDVIAAFDINTVAIDVYKHNFPGVQLMNRNIQWITAKMINKMNVDTILMSPPCQPFTRVGLQKDSADNRTSSLFHVLTLIPQLPELKYILVENVKGFENSETRNALVQCISDSGFRYKELILSPCQFGVPNSRTRYYLLAKKKELSFCFNDDCKLDFNIPEEILKLLPSNKYEKLIEESVVQDCYTRERCFTLDKILEKPEDDRYLIPKEQLQKRAWILDIRCPKSDGSCCFTKAYGHYLEGTGSVYCPYSLEIVKARYEEATKKNIHSNEALEILQELKLRFFTPKEVARLMSFPESFSFPEHITDRQKYRLLGNSLNVYVVSKLINLLLLTTVV